MELPMRQIVSCAELAIALLSMWKRTESLVLAAFLVSGIVVIYYLLKLLCSRGSPAPAHQETDSENTSVRTLNGLEPSVVASFPVIIHQSSQQQSSQPLTRKCPVCLEEFQRGDALRVLPWCAHSFHVECIDPWLRQNSTCPVCRMSLRHSPSDANRLPPSPVLAFSSPEILSARSSFHTGEGEDEIMAATNFRIASSRAAAGAAIAIRPVPDHRERSALSDARKWNLRYWSKKYAAGEPSNAPESLTINIRIDLESSRVRAAAAEGPSSI